MEREHLATDDLDSLSKSNTSTVAQQTNSTLLLSSVGQKQAKSFGQNLVKVGREKMESFTGSSSSSSRHQKHRISGNSSNQVETIADATMGNNDNDHSFEQQTTERREIRGRRRIVEEGEESKIVAIEAASAADRAAAAASAASNSCYSQEEQEEKDGLLLVCKRNEMMQQIVESAESKLMRHREMLQQLERQQQQQQQQKQRQQHSAQAFDHQLVPVASSVTSTGEDVKQQQHSRIKAKASLMLLKSPAFATNTLDESELDKLASSNSLPSYNDNSDEKPLRELSGTVISSKQQQQQQLVVTDCGSSVNMINRAHPSDGILASNLCCASSSSTSTSSCSNSCDTKQLQDYGTRESNEVIEVVAGNIEAANTVAASEQVASVGARVEQTGGDNDDEFYSLKQQSNYDTTENPNKLLNHDQNRHKQDIATTPDSSSAAAAAVDDERGGPTPTNDLIRTLIHRDRVALLSGGNSQAQLRASQLLQNTAPKSQCHFQLQLQLQSQLRSKEGSSGSCGKSIVEEEQQLNKNKVVSGPMNEEATMIRAEMAKEPKLTSGASHNNDTCPNLYKREHCCYHQANEQQQNSSLSGCSSSSFVEQSNRNENLQSDKVRLEGSCKDCCSCEVSKSEFCRTQVELSNSNLPPAPTSSSSSSLVEQENKVVKKQSFYETSGLSALIGKCQKLQLSPKVESYQPAEEVRSGNLVALQTNEPSFSFSGKQMNPHHQTYLFPLLLKRTGSNSDDSDDDDEDEVQTSETDFDLSLSSSPPSQMSEQQQVGKEEALHESVLLANCRLRLSASSPSALSTPTNQQEMTTTSCQRSCCRESGQLAITQAQNTNLVPSSNISLENRHQRRRKISLSGGETATSGSQQHRKRMGSNPLDRLRLGSHCLNSQKSTPSKRHSIIQALTGGHQVVSRLSHPRSFFTSSNQQHSSTTTSHKQQRTLLESTNPPPTSSTEMSSPKWNQISTNTSEQYDPLIPEIGFKIVVMGTSGSGKTSIIQRFMYDSFNWRHIPTVEDTYFIEFPYMKNMINISISDTSGTYQFPAMKRLAINSGDAFILVYSVDDPKSFDDLEQLRQTILDEREQAYSEAAFSLMTSQQSSASNSTSGLASGYCSNTSVASTSLHLPQQQQQPTISNNEPPTTCKESAVPSSPARHWSLASIFQHNHHHHNNHHHHQLQQQQQLNQCSLNNHHSSLGSFSSSSSNNNNSSTDHSSRRSSISAAEAALKTRRTRRPPMVIVANKYDLPEDRHLINSDEIEALVEIDWNNGFVRASAALNLNIDEIFQQVLKEARQPPTLTAAIVSKRRKSLPPKLPQSTGGN